LSYCQKILELRQSLALSYRKKILEFFEMAEKKPALIPFLQLTQGDFEAKGK